jgi:hypothetical protein
VDLHDSDFTPDRPARGDSMRRSRPALSANACTQFPASPWSWYVVAGGTAKILRSQRLGVLGFSVDCENVNLESRWRAMKSTYLPVLIDLITCCYRTDCKNSTPVHLARQTRNQYSIMRRRLVCSIQSVIPPLSRSLVHPFTVPDCVNPSVTTLPIKPKAAPAERSRPKVFLWAACSCSCVHR